MAPHATHAEPMAFPTGGVLPRSRRRWRHAVLHHLRWAWIPLWLASAVGITWGVMELVSLGTPTVSFEHR